MSRNLQLLAPDHFIYYTGITLNDLHDFRGDILVGVVWYWRTVETVLREEGRYCAATVTHKVTLGEIVELLKSFAEQPRTLMIPEIPNGSFAKKLYSTYLSYLPASKVAFPLKMNVDDRGSFTELVHTLNAGQVSINISKPGITKGQHWHNTKFEQFIVVKGHGLIQQRNLNDPEGKVLEWEV